MCEVYVLLSEKDNKRYIGSTDNLERRLKQHNSGYVKSTKNRRPLKLIFRESFSIESEARKREHFFKTHKRFNELSKIIIK